jgi:hypothetical protein
MAFRERIELVVDVITGNTNSSLRNLKNDIGEADGAFAKLKVAGSGAFDFIKQNAVGFGLAAGAAITGFAVKAVGDFQEVALGAGQLRDSLGITADEASRLQEVAGDLGIGVDSVETAIGRMNRTAEASPEHFDAIGASIARNKDGTIDVIGTFENAAEAIDKIPDAGKRAEAAQQIFGRGWQDIAELIRYGADGIRDSMESVESAKVVDDSDIERARKFRDTMDELKGVLESVSIAVGERVVPLVEAAGEAILGVKTALDTLKDALPEGQAGDEFWTFLTGSALDQVKRIPELIGQLGDQIGDLGEPTISASVAMGELGTAADFTGGEFESLDGEVDSAGESMERASGKGFILGDALDFIDTKYRSMRDNISSDQSLIDLERQFGDVLTAGLEAFTANANGAIDAREKTLDHESSVNSLKNQIIDYAEEIGNVPPEWLTEILALVDDGQLDEAKRKVDELDGRVAHVQVRVSNPAGEHFIDSPHGSGRAAGGPVTAGTVYPVGERGPELFVPNSNGTIIPNNRLGGGGTASTINLTVNVTAPPGVNEYEWGRKIAAESARFLRYSGAT